MKPFTPSLVPGFSIKNLAPAATNVVGGGLIELDRDVSMFRSRWSWVWECWHESKLTWTNLNHGEVDLSVAGRHDVRRLNCETWVFRNVSMNGL